MQRGSVFKGTKFAKGKQRLCFALSGKCGKLGATFAMALIFITRETILLSRLDDGSTTI